MKISILLQQFDQTIFEGIIAQFDWEYLIKKIEFYTVHTNVNDNATDIFIINFVSNRNMKICDNSTFCFLLVYRYIFNVYYQLRQQLMPRYCPM